MTTEAAFLKALRNKPDDDATRLVFADWLEERGDERAAWMRAQVQVPKKQAELRIMEQEAANTLERTIQAYDWQGRSTFNRDETVRLHAHRTLCEARLEEAGGNKEGTDKFIFTNNALTVMLTPENFAQHAQHVLPLGIHALMTAKAIPPQSLEMLFNCDVLRFIDTLNMGTYDIELDQGRMIANSPWVRNVQSLKIIFGTPQAGTALGESKQLVTLDTINLQEDMTDNFLEAWRQNRFMRQTITVNGETHTRELAQDTTPSHGPGGGDAVAELHDTGIPPEDPNPPGTHALAAGSLTSRRIQPHI